MLRQHPTLLDVVTINIAQYTSKFGRKRLVPLPQENKYGVLYLRRVSCPHPTTSNDGMYGYGPHAQRGYQHGQWQHTPGLQNAM